MGGRVNKSWWNGRGPEDIEFIKELSINTNLEDKIAADGDRDVTVELYLNTVVQRLRDDLGIIEETVGEGVADSTLIGEVIATRPSRTRQSTRKNDFVYDLN